MDTRIEFYTIYSWMRDDLKLSGTELDCYAVIYCLSQGDNRYIAGVKNLMQLLHKSEPSVISALKNLTIKELVKKEPVLINKITHYYYKAVRPTKVPTKEILDNTLNNLSNPTLKNLSNTYNIKDNNININKKLSKDNEKDQSIFSNFVDFGDFWKKYHQGSKQVALKRWNAMSTKDQKLAYDMIDDYLIYCKRSKRPKKDVATFLYNKCYKDDYKNIIPDYYQEQPIDNERMIKFKRYMVSRFKDLIYHRNPLTFEQASDLIDKWNLEQFEWAMDKLSKMDIHQFYSINDGVNKVLENDNEI